jgi:hypothetical protein
MRRSLWTLTPAYHEFLLEEMHRAFKRDFIAALYGNFTGTALMTDVKFMLVGGGEL